MNKRFDNLLKSRDLQNLDHYGKNFRGTMGFMI